MIDATMSEPTESSVRAEVRAWLQHDAAARPPQS